MKYKEEEKCCLSTLNSEWHFIFTVIILEEKMWKSISHMLSKICSICRCYIYFIFNILCMNKKYLKLNILTSFQNIFLICIQYLLVSMTWHSYNLLIDVALFCIIFKMTKWCQMALITWRLMIVQRYLCIYKTNVFYLS